MYWLTPFHYLLEGFLAVVVHGVPVRCVPREASEFSPPSGMTCQEYAGSYASQIGGYVQDAGNGLCAFCQYSVGDVFVCLYLSYPYDRETADTNALLPGPELQRLLLAQMA